MPPAGTRRVYGWASPFLCAVAAPVCGLARNDVQEESVCKTSSPVLHPGQRQAKRLRAELVLPSYSTLPHLLFAGLLCDGLQKARLRRFRAAFFCPWQRRPAIPRLYPDKRKCPTIAMTSLVSVHRFSAWAPFSFFHRARRYLSFRQDEKKDRGAQYAKNVLRTGHGTAFTPPASLRSATSPCRGGLGGCKKRSAREKRGRPKRLRDFHPLTVKTKKEMTLDCGVSSYAC